MKPTLIKGKRLYRQFLVQVTNTTDTHLTKSVSTSERADVERASRTEEATERTPEGVGASNRASEQSKRAEQANSASDVPTAPDWRYILSSCRFCFRMVMVRQHVVTPTLGPSSQQLYQLISLNACLILLLKYS